MSQAIKQMSAKEFYDLTDPICHAGLKASLNPKNHLYDLQLMDKNWHNTYEFYSTEDLTSTAICLIGVSRAKIDPASIDLDLPVTLEAMFDLCKSRGYPGGFGLVVWANAVCDGVDLETLQFRCGISLQNFEKHVAALTTMETAWLASGLAHEYQRTESEYVKGLLDTITNELILIRYQPEHHVVSHAGDKPDSGHGIRRWIANFADQVYTIQALAFIAKLTDNEKALEVSSNIAAKMVSYQGDKGQWWWHYDAKRGGVPQPYSVYSVHQHGMAPMALRALEAAGGNNYETAIVKSRSWLDNNELDTNMIDPQRPTIWRSLDYSQGMVGDITRKARSLLGVAGDQSRKAVPTLKLNYETRPYEWAWCIYAGAIERKIDPELHIV